MDFEVGKGPITFLFFGMWQQFETNASTKSGRFDADTKIELAIIDGALAYKFFDKSFSGADPLSSRLTLEILGGARWTYLSSDVDINGGPLGGTSNSRDADWIDPYVGLRGVHNFSQNFNISAMGTVGGFGVGSDLAWSAVAIVEYRITRRIGVFAGYKVISYDYDHNGFIWDVKLQGPVAGLSIRW